MEQRVNVSVRNRRPDMTCCDSFKPFQLNLSVHNHNLMSTLLLTLITLKLKTFKLYLSKSLLLDFLTFCLLLSLNLCNLDPCDSDKLTLITNHIGNGLALLPLCNRGKRLAMFWYLHFDKVIIVKSKRVCQRTQR